MLTRERMDRMIDARDEGDRGAVPDPRVAEVFQMKYDYHNAKTLVKGEAMGADIRRLLSPGGRYDPEQMADGYQKENLSGVSPTFQRAVQEARTILKETGDPQRSDVALDRACFGEMAQLAKDCKSAFLEGYVRLCIDAANLRTAVRVGGNVSEKTLSAARGEDLGSLFQTGPLAKAAELGAKAARPAGGPLTAFERECDNAVTRYVSDAKRVPFGEETVIAYLYAREAELTAIRTILASRRAGLDGAAIRERLRDTYV